VRPDGAWAQNGDAVPFEEDADADEDDGYAHYADA
jgi:hypothetical protein